MMAPPSTAAVWVLAVVGCSAPGPAGRATAGPSAVGPTAAGLAAAGPAAAGPTPVPFAQGKAPALNDASPPALPSGGPPNELPAPLTVCNEQPPQSFLMRHTYVYDQTASPAEREEKKALHRAAIEYRTRHYGRVPGVGDPSWNPHAASLAVRRAHFFGLPLFMNERVLVALGCVEQHIRRDCRDDYLPTAVSGWRDWNTFTNGEVSNHRWGIAIDIDYGLNPCCGCIPAISDRPLCKKPVASPFDRTVIPRCWVEVFERYGFSWLGYDQLEDTMHFEFLGDPNRILRAPRRP